MRPGTLLPLSTALIFTPYNQNPLFNSNRRKQRKPSTFFRANYYRPGIRLSTTNAPKTWMMLPSAIWFYVLKTKRNIQLCEKIRSHGKLGTRAEIVLFGSMRSSFYHKSGDYKLCHRYQRRPWFTTLEPNTAFSYWRKVGAAAKYFRQKENYWAPNVFYHQSGKRKATFVTGRHLVLYP